MPRRLTALSQKEQRFVTEYLVDGNATRSAIAAGYAQRNATSTGYELLQKPHIKDALGKALKAQEKRTLVTADANLREIEQLAREARAARQFGAAVRARELIGKHYRSFTDKVELTGKNDGPVEFTEIRRTIVRADPKA